MENFTDHGYVKQFSLDTSQNIFDNDSFDMVEVNTFFSINLIKLDKFY